MMSECHIKNAPSNISWMFLFFVEASGLALANTATITVNWNHFSIEAYDIGYGVPTVSATNPSTSVDTQAGQDFDYDSSDDWSTSIHADSTNGNTEAHASADADTLFASGTPGDFDINSSFWRGEDFSVDHFGVLVFSVPYSIEKDSDQVSAYVYMDISWDDWHALTSSDFWLGNDDTGDFSGMLHLALFAEPGTDYTFEVSGDIYGQGASPVPVPASAFLLATGLGLYFGTRKTRS